jgi:ribonuclease R
MTKQKHTKDPWAKQEAKKYAQPIPSRKFILSHLEAAKKPLSYDDVAELLKLSNEDDLEALRRRLIAMTRDGELVKMRSNKYAPTNKLDLIRGRVSGHSDGHGFLIPEDQTIDDVFLPHKQMRSVFDGDTVLVRTAQRDTRGRNEGVIIRVLQRKHQQMIGRFFLEGGVGFLVPDNRRIPHDIIIPRKEQADAQVGDVVTVDIISQPTSRTQAVGKIVEVLGAHMEAGMETEMAIRSHDLPHLWPEAVSTEAKALPDEVTENVLTPDRKDLRKLPFVTIDGEDARDFDDAVYCEKNEKTGWRLYVAIADVSHYVTPDMAMNEEALNRGNSVYFPARVVPMLPEKLSNGLCSLKPRVDRLALVCEMNINKTGQMTRYEFYPAVIHSHARLTYTKVAAILEENDAALTKEYAPLVPRLQELFALYLKLKAYRQNQGAISFELVEPQVVFDEHQKIKALKPLVRNEAHKLIEQCMLTANEAAALYLEKHKWPGPFRVHPGPKQEKLVNVLTFLNELGLGLRGGMDPSPQDYNKLLDQTRERPDQHVIQMVLLRSLAQAYYSTANEGHFGLAFEAYTHFTSPIRRFPDLLVHRAIYAVLNKQKSQKEGKEAIENAARHCSMTERRADDASRDVLSWLKCEFMQDKVGEDFMGVISGVTGFGLFIELEGIFVEGLVHISTLDNDYYQFDATHHRLIGERTGKVYAMGDELQVRVARVNVEQRQIDFELLLDKKKKTPKKKSRRKPKKK